MLRHMRYPRIAKLQPPLKTCGAVLVLLALVGAWRLSGAKAGVPPVDGFEAYFTERSYAPGQHALLRVRNGSKRLTIRIFRAGGEQGNTRGNSTLRGVAVEPARIVRAGAQGHWATVRVKLQFWPSGFYFARVQTQSGHMYFAAFVLRATPILRGRVAVVMPTNTWQAYNFRDDEGDGVPNTWYGAPTVKAVNLSRPYLNRGVPPHFRQYDLGFIRWLTLTGKAPDFYADDDLERFRNPRQLAARYDLIVFPGHEEYVTEHVYNLIRGFYGGGGNLIFLTANNFFARVVRSGTSITRTDRWRDVGRPEASWMGIQYLDWFEGKYPNRPYVIVGAHRAPWLFERTGLRNGDQFGAFGIEIDMRTPQSPAGVQLLATVPDIFGPGKSAEMVLSSSPAGGQLFAAGAMTLGGSALLHPTRQILANLWARFTGP